MRFKRNTHNEDGTPRPGLPVFRGLGRWPTCNIHLVGDRPRTLGEIHETHQKYDQAWGSEGFDYSLADIMEGLAHLIRMGLVVVVDSSD